VTENSSLTIIRHNLVNTQPYESYSTDRTTPLQIVPLLSLSEFQSGIVHNEMTPELVHNLETAQYNCRQLSQKLFVQRESVSLHHRLQEVAQDAETLQYTVNLVNKNQFTATNRMLLEAQLAQHRLQQLYTQLDVIEVEIHRQYYSLVYAHLLSAAQHPQLSNVTPAEWCLDDLLPQTQQLLAARRSVTEAEIRSTVESDLRTTTADPSNRATLFREVML
jgi:hypothetical protein